MAPRKRGICMQHLVSNSVKTLLLLAALATGSAYGQSAPTSSGPAMPGAGSNAVAAPKQERPYLGVYIEGAADGGGVALAEIAPDSPAARANLQAGDVIIALGGKTVGSEEELRDAIAASGVGNKVTITYLRDGAKRRTSARLAAAPLEDTSVGVQSDDGEVVELRRVGSANSGGLVEVMPEAAAPAAEGGSGWLGVQLEMGEGGTAVVQSVVEGSPAEKAGLQAGDVFQRVDGEEVGSVDGLVATIGSHQAGDSVRLVVQRGDKPVKLKATLGSREAGIAGMGGAATTGPTGAGGMRVAPPGGATSRSATPAPAARDHAEPHVVPHAEAHQDPNAGPIAGARREIADLKRQLQELRARCEQQQKTLDAIRSALGGTPQPGSGREPTPDSAPMPGGSTSFAPAGMESSFTFAGTPSASDGSGAVTFTPHSGGGGFAVVGTPTASTQTVPPMVFKTVPQNDGQFKIEFQAATGSDSCAVGGEACATTDCVTNDGASGGESCCAASEPAAVAVAADGGTSEVQTIVVNGDGQIETLAPGTYQIVHDGGTWQVATLGDDVPAELGRNGQKKVVVLKKGNAGQEVEVQVAPMATNKKSVKVKAGLAAPEAKAAKPAKPAKAAKPAKPAKAAKAAKPAKSVNLAPQHAVPAGECCGHCSDCPAMKGEQAAAAAHHGAIRQLLHRDPVRVQTGSGLRLPLRARVRHVAPAMQGQHGMHGGMGGNVEVIIVDEEGNQRMVWPHHGAQGAMQFGGGMGGAPFHGVATVVEDEEEACEACCEEEEVEVEFEAVNDESAMFEVEDGQFLLLGEDGATFTLFGDSDEGACEVECVIDCTTGSEECCEEVDEDGGGVR